MQSSNIPVKFLVPFAQNDSAKVEIPVTTSDSTRASQSLGFPPLTMQPPEAGGVPPQGEDFNGALNQVARIAWWLMLGGGFPYDSAFASASQISGYPKGAMVQRADLTGWWLNQTEGNTTNPDTGGAGWVQPYAALNGSASNRFSAADAVAATDVVSARQIQTNQLNYAIATGSNNALVVARTPTRPSIADGEIVYFQTPSDFTNSAGVTLNVDGTGACSILGPGGASLQGTEFVPSGKYAVMFRSSDTTYSLIAQGRGALQVGGASQSFHAVQLQQVQAMNLGGLGGTPRLSASVAAGATSVTFSDDYVNVSSSPSAAGHKVDGVTNMTLNLSTVGIGGMDTGVATANGILGVYRGYNKSTGAVGVWGQMEGSAPLTATYSGANAPSGFTESALIAVLPISATTGQFGAFTLTGREVSIGTTQVTSGTTSSTAKTYAGLTVTTLPYSANAALLNAAVQINGNATGYVAAATSTSGTGEQLATINTQASTGGAVTIPLRPLAIVSPRILFWYAATTNASVSMVYSIGLVGWRF